MVDDVQQNRVAHIRRLIRDDGGSPRKLADEIGVGVSFLSQMAGERRPGTKQTSARRVTDTTARKIEDARGMTRGALDLPLAANSAKHSREQAPVYDAAKGASAVVTAVIEAWTAAGLAPNAAKQGEIAELALADAAEQGRVRRDFITKLIELAR